MASGGVVFTTIQKFLPEQVGVEHPLLSDRRNIVVIADEAHRSQHDLLDGFARHLRDALPDAAFIGFTGTPIETAEKNTRAVFGDYIDTCDIQRAVEDRATVPIYYEGRLAKREAHRRGEELGLNEDELVLYDGLETNDSAVAALGDETLKTIAQELVETVKKNATIDWNLRESARAKMRVMVKRLLRKYGYPPDKREHATQLVLAQAEVVCEEWAA